MKKYKTIDSIHHGHAPHMVGDGLPVRNFFSYGDLGRRELSPFLMLDYGSPSEFPPTDKVLGVGMHPHRGFETVTLVFQGGLEHRDTAGNAGTIGAGDVQWMTAGSGVLHEELHSAAFRKTGGTLQMIQLWVNLPASLKMTPPRYQTLLKADIPQIQSHDNKVSIRLIAGRNGNIDGIAKTYTPINLWDVAVQPGGSGEFVLPNGFTTALFLIDGQMTLTSDSDSRTVSGAKLIVASREGEVLKFSSTEGAHVILMNGEPIEEPVVGYGPFVMNSQAQIIEAFQEFQQGRFGTIKGGK